MSRFLPLLIVGLALVLPLHADDQVKDVQAELKKQEFYFGEVDGQPGTTTSAAIRRYQIRNGLAVTGAIDDETLQSLGIGGAAPAPPSNQVAPAPVNPAGGPATRPPTDLRRSGQPSAEEPENPSRPPSGQPAQPGDDGPPNQPSARYRAIFAGTPYMNAPRVVQEETYSRAIRALTERGFLGERAEARTPASLEEGLLSFQRKSRLPLSGKMDLETLGALQLLPGRGVGNPRVAPASGPGSRGGPARLPPPRPYPDEFVR